MKRKLPFAAALVGAAFAAGAQEAPRDEALNVTATRIERPSLETPASVDSVQADDIRFARPQVNLSESLGRVPGIMVQNRQNYAQDLQVSSRGFGTRATFGIRGMRLVADGIPASMPDGQGQAANFDLGSAERIEVLRGPFAVMYGNAAGGVINVLTESGAREPGMSLDFAAGSYGMLRGAVKASDRGENSDLIVNMSRFAIGGYRDHSSAARDQVNAKMNFGIAPATKLTLLVNAYDSPDVQDPLGLVRADYEANPRQVVAGALTFNTRKSVRQNQAGALLTHELGASTLQITAYAGQRGVVQYLAIPLVFQNAATHSGGVVDLARDYSGTSVRWTKPATLADRPLTLIVGAEYERQAEHRRGYINNNGVQGALKRDEDDVVASTGIYVQGEWRFAEQWIALAGARANRVAFRSEDHFVVTGNPDDSGNVTYRATTPMAGLLYRVSPVTSVYANVGRGFETPTFAELAYQPAPATGLSFALLPSRSRHTEAGIKSGFGAARANLAVFRIDTVDEIVVNTNAGGRQTFQNAGRTRRQGIELAAQSPLPLGFEAIVAWTVLDARFRDSFVSNGVTVPADNVLPAVAHSMLYGELRWAHAASGFTAAIEALRKSKVAVNDVNSDFAEAYVVANVAAGFAQERGTWRVSEYLRVDNITDKRYAGSVIVNDGNSRFFEPAPGRNWTIGVQARAAF